MGLSQRAYVISLTLLLFFLTWILSPLLAIWALNTLFDLGIAYQVKTWFATLILTAVIRQHGPARK